MSQNKNQLADLVLNNLSRRREIFEDKSSIQVEYDIVGSVIGQAYSGTYEWYTEAADKNKQGNATFRIHARNQYNFMECYKKFPYNKIPNKFSQLGSKKLIELIDQCLRERDLQTFPLNERYAQFSIDKSKISPRDFANAINLHERSLSAFEKSICCMPVFSNKEIVDTPDVQSLLEYSSCAFDNECLYTTSPKGDDLWKYRKPKASSEIKFLTEKIENPICFMKSGCRNNTCILNDSDVLDSITVFFGPNTPSYEHFKCLYAGKSEIWGKIHRASIELNKSLTREHFVSKHECSKLGINPDFPGNVLVCCQSCNSSLSNKHHLAKLNLVAKANGLKVAHDIFEDIYWGLKKTVEYNIVSNFRMKAEEAFPAMFRSG